MNITLLHNANAGGGGRIRPGELIEAIRQEGHSVVYQTTGQKGQRWELCEPTDLVVAAGGDGTVRKAAFALAGHHIPLAILPLGTANNIARTFGLTAPIPDLIRRFSTGRRARFDVGLATGPWGKIPFLESAGAGLLARLIANLSRPTETSPAPSVASGIGSLRELLANYPGEYWRAILDGRELAGKFLMAEAVNTSSTGPNLPLAPEGKPGDGQLNFVFLKEEERTAFDKFLENLNGPTSEQLPLKRFRGRHLSLTLRKRDPVHVDDFTWPDDNQEAGHNGAGAGEAISLEITLAETPVELLV